MPETNPPFRCAICGGEIDSGAGFILNIEVFADPQMPPMTSAQIAAANFDEALDEVLKQAENMTADDLQDGVYRKFSYRLCPACHGIYLANPLGMPRKMKLGRN
jgi:hypothetical protein